MKISRPADAEMSGPATGDCPCLADKDLWVKVEGAHK